MSLPKYSCENLSAHQVLDLFYDRYGVDTVKLVLLEVFQCYVLNDKKGLLSLSFKAEVVGEVFDGLLGLVGAVRELMEEGVIEGIGGNV